MHIWRSPIRVTRSKLENAILDPVSALRPCPHRRSSDPRDFLSFMREKLSGDNKFYDGGGGGRANGGGKSRAIGARNSLKPKKAAAPKKASIMRRGVGR